MKITNPKRFAISCGVIAVTSFNLVLGGVNMVSNFIENANQEEEFNNQDYIPLLLEAELREAFDLSEEDITRGIGTFIAKHDNWEELIQDEGWVIAWFSPSTQAMYDFYAEYR